MPSKYYNSYGQKIYNPRAYAKTGAPMFTGFTNYNGKRVSIPESYVEAGGTLYSEKNINQTKSVYKVECKHNKTYIGETYNLDKRTEQHFSGQGSQVTKKYTPKKITELAQVPGYFSKEVEQRYTEKYIKKNGYENVRGGKYTNSHTL